MTALQKAETDRLAETLNLTMVEKRIETHSTTPISKTTAEFQYKKAQTIADTLKAIHVRIINLALAPEQLTSQESEYIALVSRCDLAMEKLREIIDSFPTPTSSTSTSTTTQRINIKLPEIPLPSFSGNFNDWPSFEDLFKSLVDKHQLTGSQKLHYLKSSVQGEAGAIIKSFISTDDNYKEAWDLLSARYNNKREIISSTIKKLLSQSKIKSESATALQSFLSTTQECVRSLKVQGRPTETWDNLLVHITVEKMDPDSCAEWARSLTGTVPPTFKQLTEFLEKHIRSLLARGITTKPQFTAKPQQFQQQFKQTRTHHSSFNQPICGLCKRNHFLYSCRELHNTPPEKRFTLIQQQTKACTNCLREDHMVNSCPSTQTCRTCNKRHHTFLHKPNNSNQASSNSAPLASTSSVKSHTASTEPTSSAQSHTASFQQNTPQVLLKTALVHVVDSSGKLQPCRALLDDGSESSFVTDKCANALGLIKSKTNVIITGISAANAGRATWRITFRVMSRIHNAHVDVEALILPKVTGALPRVPCDTSAWNHLNNLQLADPTYNKPGEVDILLGADVVASIMREGRRQGIKNSPIAQNSILGWVLSGKISTATNPTIITSNHATIHLDKLVQKFWEVPTHNPLSPDEAACEKLFETTTFRDNIGRYVVRLPLRTQHKSNPIDDIGETKPLAQRRLLSLERRFERHPTHHQSYIKFMREYITLGHMEITTEQCPAVYIPHHFVIKDDTTTTKLRVVFDGSMKSTKGVSLNDVLLVGPVVQDDLWSILLRFRLHPIAIKADVAKMYRQYVIHPDDRNLQRILWRENKNEPIQEYKLKTVTYGTSSASYLATRCLQQLAKDEEHNFPAASSVVSSDMYVDDLLSGASSSPSAIQLIQQLRQLISAGGMEIRKWCSSDPNVLHSIPPELREEGSELSFDSDSTIKALGIRWNPASDTFTFTTTTQPDVSTRRQLLAELAKTFGPIGWISPLVITGKIIFQQSWKSKQEWDDKLDDNIKQQFYNYQKQIQSASAIKIPRCVYPITVKSYDLVGFSDSSEKAYAAAVYLRCEHHNGSFTSNLLTSKTKIAPMKQVSLPRLELCAAVLLAETIESVATTIKKQCNITCFTDSMIVINWLRSSSKRWKTFVANRVATIQELTPSSCWHHVISADNPADLPSRGTTASELQSSSLWWHGPTWLCSSSFPSSETAQPIDEEAITLEERKETTSNHTTTTTPFIRTFMENFSTLNKLVTATAILLQFIKFKVKHDHNLQYPVTIINRIQAMNSLIRAVQQQHFQNDLKSIRSNKPLQKSSKLTMLCPFIDDKGLLRVGGRLQKSSLPDSAKHPILLPKHSQLTTLIIRESHQVHLHGGVTLIHSAIRQQFWILGAKDIIRFTIRKCIRCRRSKAQTMSQQMGQLPSPRVQPHRPFLHTGTDFAGPFQVKMRKGRGSPADKCYFAIFICLSTKAVHLEAVTDLSSHGFIAAFKRFSSRRGLPSNIYCDCGTNFVGGNRELQQQLKTAEKEIESSLSHLGTKFNFNVPASPFRGGLWEAGVKSVKYHFTRVIGNTKLTYEQFETVLCGIEACLNSRPLSPMSADPNDVSALTPGHFLIGAPLTAVPEQNVTSIPENRLSYWQHTQQIIQHYWRRWRNEYMTTLQQRHKWKTPQRNLTINDLVIIQDDNLPPTMWKLDRVVSTHSGSDGFVRSAALRTVVDATSKPVRFNEINRPVQKLSPILLHEDL